MSRRGFLARSATLLAGTALAKFAAVLHVSPVFSQTLPKHIYIAPDDHTDYMWTADEQTYRQAFLEMIDYYLDQADATASEPSDYQSRWNCDGSFWMWTYEHNKPPADWARLISRIKSGHISVPLTPLVVCYGGMPAEAVLRGMYYAGRIERRYNLRFTLALAMENQTLPYGLGALWAGAGAKYSWRGICGCATKVSDPGDRLYDIYWWQGPDGSRLLMKWNSMLISNQSMGGYAEARDPSAVVDYVDTDAGFKARYDYNVIGAFGKGWDDLQTTTSQFVAIAKNKTNSTRRVIVSNELDFFKDFEATYGQSLPSLSCSFGNEWDVYCASMAEVSARVKRAVEKLRSAEALAALVSLYDPGFLDGRDAARDQAWMDLGMYWEHDWSADGPVGQNARRDWQRKLAGRIESYVNALHADAANALAGRIQKNGSDLCFYVFNPLSWTRTDIADLPYSDTTSPVHVIDLTTGLEVPAQFVTLDGQSYLRVLASQVPPVGYKVFSVQPGVGNSFSNAASVTGNVIENDLYRITVADRGAITSLIDKTRGSREFARVIGGRVINDLGSGAGTLQVADAGPVFVTLLATSATPLAHTTRITLVRDSRRIDIRNDINENFSDTYTWNFSFNLDSPDVWHEEVGAVARARLLSQGGHYSPRNARYDWLTLNHFADVSDGQVGVTLSNADCYFMRLGNSTAGTLDVNTPQISPLVGGQVDGSTLGISNQGGDTHFMQRFALQPHDAYDPVAAMKFALEHQNPFVTAEITGGNMYPGDTFSLVEISDPNVLLWALKPAEDDKSHTLVARVWNLSSGPASFTLSLAAGPIRRAQNSTHIETPLGDAVISDGRLVDTLGAQQLKTFLIGNPLDSYIYLPLILKQD